MSQEQMIERMFEMFDESQMEEIRQIGELPQSKVCGYDVVKKEKVNREWERGLSDILFRITGFSQFFGVLAFQCKFHWSVAIPTAGAIVEGGNFHILINPVFLYNFLQKGSYQSFVIVHEVYHIFFDHTERRMMASYDPTIWNIACDYYIHIKLDEMINSASGLAATRNTVELIPQDVFPICFDKKYEGMSEDEIYKELVQESGGDGGNGGNGSGGSGSGQYALDQAPESHESNDANSSTNKTAIARAVNAAVSSAMQQGKGIGSAEAGIIREFAELTKPKVDWHSKLQDKMETVRDQQITYSHYNRRSTDEVIFPSKTGEHITLFFGVDSSGSMNDRDLGESSSELQGIMNQLDSWHITVATCDAKAYPVCELASDEDDELTKDKLQFRGGGGTELSPMVKYAQELEDDVKPSIIIILTDGEVPVEPIEKVYDGEIPLLFIITSDGNESMLGESFDCIKLEYDD